MDPSTLEPRQDSLLPQLFEGEQGLYLRSVEYFGRSSEAKNLKKKQHEKQTWKKKNKFDQLINYLTEQPSNE